jgi:type IV pilus biogenesis protein PilP
MNLFNRPALTFAKCVSVAAAMVSSPVFAVSAPVNDAPPAQAAASPASGATGYQLPTWATYYQAVDAIRADTQKAQAELDNLQIHHQLEEARKGNFSHDGDKPASANPAVPAVMNIGQQAAAAPAHPTHDPMVQAVSMVDDRWTAVIELSSGARVSVHEGEAVRGLGTVAHIALGEVTVNQGGKVTALQFAGDNAQAAQTTTTSTPMVPGFPGGMPLSVPIMH